MRNMVEHGQISGSSDTTVLSGVSSVSRCTRWISVPTAMVDAGGRGVDRLDDVVGRADLVGELEHTSWAHSGWATTMPSGCSARKASTCSGRKRWCTEQWPFHSRKVASLQSASVSPPSSKRGFHTRMSSCGEAHGDAGVAAEVLVGEEERPSSARTAPSRRQRPASRPTRGSPGVGRRAHRAAVAADERLQRGRRVHVGDRDDRLDVDDRGQRLPRLLDLVEVGHVGHRAAGVEVGEDHLLVVGGEDVGRLGHEVHAAEHDVVGLGPLLGQHRQAVASRPGRRPSA